MLESRYDVYIFATLWVKVGDLLFHSVMRKDDLQKMELPN